MELGLYTFGSMFGDPVTGEQFDHEAGPQGAILAGDAEEIIERVRWQRSVIGMDRLLLQIDWGGMPFSMTKRAVEILGTEVAPALREEPGRPPAT